MVQSNHLTTLFRIIPDTADLPKMKAVFVALLTLLARQLIVIHGSHPFLYPMRLGSDWVFILVI